MKWRAYRLPVAVALAVSIIAGCSPAAPRSPSGFVLGQCAVATSPGSERGGFSPGGALPTSQPDASVDHDLRGMRAAGAGWVRVDFNWSALETRQGRIRWAHLDAVVGAARCHGLRVLALPAYTPDWARPAGTDDKHPPSDPSRFADFVAAAARHFGPRVAAWELWNEPNLSQFWSPHPDPAQYGVLLRLAAAALRRVEPSALILSGGLAPTQGGDLVFLQAIIDSGGLGPVDGVAMHPYSYPTSPADSASAFFRLERVHEALVGRGLANLKIWATEIGAATGRSRIAVTDGLQAVSVTDAYRLWASPSWRPWTGALLWYSWRDVGNDLADGEQNFGLLRVDGTPKPALGAYKAALAAPSAP